MLTRKNLPTVIAYLLILIVLFVACSGPAETAPITQTGSQPGTITVVGTGEAFGQPDQAQVQVGVETISESAAEASTQNQANVQKILDALTAQGVALEDMQTTNYSLWVEQRYNEQGIATGINAYHVSNQVNVTIRDINKVGDILAAVTEAGANTIYGVGFSVADSAGLEAEAREKAVADARERAESLATLAGVELGDVQSISEVIGGQPVPYYREAMAAADSAPGIMPGQLSYQMQVQVTFSLQ